MQNNIFQYLLKKKKLLNVKKKNNKYTYIAID